MGSPALQGVRPQYGLGHRLWTLGREFFLLGLRVLALDLCLFIQCKTLITRPQTVCCWHERCTQTWEGITSEKLLIGTDHLFLAGREVPHYVSSAGPPSHEDSSTAFKEFQAANGGRDLPLRYLQFAPATSSVKTYYHPFNIPPQWCSAIEYVGTNDVWEIAPEGRMYSLEGYINIGKPGEAKLWVPQICEDFDLDIP